MFCKVVNKIALRLGNVLWGRSAWLVQLTIAIENRTRAGNDFEHIGPEPWPWKRRTLY